MPGGRRGQLSLAMREVAAVRRQVGHDRPLSLDEAVHVAQDISRREFLRRGAVAGAGLALAGCVPAGKGPPHVQSRGEEPPIAIVGAGLAGLTAAHWLTQAGVPARVFEAQDRIGGRCWSARGFGGLIGEHGGEFIDTGHIHTRRLVRELGLALDDTWESYGQGSWGRTFVGGEGASRQELFTGLDGVVRRLTRTAEENGPFLADRAGPRAVAFDRRTMADWFEENLGDLDSPAVRILAAEQVSWWGLDPDKLSATNLIDFFCVDYAGADERWTVHGGNDLIAETISDRLPPGSLELDTPLEAIRRRGDDRYELAFPPAREVSADHVILTIPLTALRNVDHEDAGFSKVKQAAIRELGMGTNTKLLMAFSDPFPMGTWNGDMLRGDPPGFQTWPSGGTDGPAAKRHGLLTVYTGGRLGASYDVRQPHGPAERDDTGFALRAIEQVVPGVSSAFDPPAWLDHWASDAFAQGSYAAFLPGQYTRFYGALGRPEGAIHFAGEHTSVSGQGFLDGAVESGSRAAIEVLTALGKPVPMSLVRTRIAARRYRPRYPW